jgi:hypothetical protein
VSVELKRERKNDAFRVEGSISPNIGEQMERFRGALGTGMVAHLEQQLQSKGISTGRRGETMVLVGRDPETSAKAILTFGIAGTTPVATLLDVEVHVPKNKDQMKPLPLQSQIFQLNPDPMSLVDVDAMCSALQERVHALEYHIEALKPIGAAVNIGVHVDDHAECKQHLESLLEHKKSLEERGGPEKTQLPIGVRTAVTFATRNLYSIEGDIALIGERATRTDSFVRQLVEANDDLAGIEARIAAVGKDYVAWKKKLAEANLKHDKVTGRFKRMFSGALSMPNIQREIKLRKRELDDWSNAIAMQRASVELALRSCADGKKRSNPLQKYDDLMREINRFRNIATDSSPRSSQHNDFDGSSPPPLPPANDGETDGSTSE